MDDRFFSIRTILAAAIAAFLVSGAPTVAEPLTVRTLPSIYESGGTSFGLNYKASVTGLAVAVARELFVFGEEQSERIALVDTDTGTVTLGGPLPTERGGTDRFAVSADRRVLMLSEQDPPSGSSTLQLFSTVDLSQWQEIAPPLAEYSEAQLFGADQSGISFFVLTYYEPDGTVRHSKFAVTTAGVFTELTAVSPDLSINAAGPLGEIALSPFTGSEPYTATIADGRLNLLLGTSAVPARTDVRGILDEFTLVFKTDGRVRLFDTQTLTEGIAVTRLYDNELVPSSSGVMTGLKEIGPYGTALTIFNESVELIPDCVYARTDSRRTHLSWAVGSTAGEEIIVAGESILDSQLGESIVVALIPDLSSPVPNYCSRISVRFLGACSKAFRRIGDSYYRASSVPLPDSCQLQVQFKREANGTGLTGRLRATVNYRRKSKVIRSALARNGVTLSVPTKRAQSIFIEASAEPSSPYLDDTLQISF